MNEKITSVNLQNLEESPFFIKKMKKVKIFMYGSAIATTTLAGFNLVHQDFLEGILLLGGSSGLFSFASSIKQENKTYLNRLTIYQKCSILSSASFFLNGIIKPAEVTLVISLFCSGNMALLAHEFNKEKKCYTLSKSSQINQVDVQK